MDTWSERQLGIALAWLGDQWNKPSRSDHYAMQISQTLCQKDSKKPNDIKLGAFKIPFLSVEEAQAAKSTGKVEGWIPGMPRPVEKADFAKRRQVDRLRSLGLSPDGSK